MVEACPKAFFFLTIHSTPKLRKKIYACTPKPINSMVKQIKVHDCEAIQRVLKMSNFFQGSSKLLQVAFQKTMGLF